MVSPRRVIALGCLLGCSQRPPEPPVVDVGETRHAELYVELEPSHATRETEPAECVAALVYQFRRQPEWPLGFSEPLGSAVDALAYLHLAERFAKDPEMDLARAASFFRDALNYPPETNPLYFYAALRLAQLEQSKRAHESAMVGFRVVARAEARYRDAPCMPELAARAREGFILSYSWVGQPNKAFDAFRPMSGDVDGQTARTLRMLVRLADLLAIRGSEDAHEVIRDIVSRRTDTASCQALHVVVRQRYFLHTPLAADLAARCAVL